MFYAANSIQSNISVVIFGDFCSGLNFFKMATCWVFPVMGMPLLKTHTYLYDDFYTHGWPICVRPPGCFQMISVEVIPCYFLPL